MNFDHHVKRGGVGGTMGQKIGIRHYQTLTVTGMAGIWIMSELSEKCLGVRVSCMSIPQYDQVLYCEIKLQNDN